MRKFTVTFVGGGNGTHVGASLCALKNLNVRILTRKTKLWNERLKITFPEGHFKTTKPMNMISCRPKEVIPGSNIVLISSPVSSYPDIFEKVLPHLDKNASIGVLFGQGHVGLMATEVIQKLNLQKRNIFALKYIPWQAKTIEYGKHAHLVGSKQSLELSTSPTSAFDIISPQISNLFDMKCEQVPFISQALSTSNQILHPARYFSVFSQTSRHKLSGWGEGSLYSKMCGPSAAVLASLDSEIMKIKEALTEEFPRIDLSSVKPCKTRILEHYSDQIEDSTTLRSLFTSAKMYRKSKFAVTPHNRGVKPLVEHRHFQDDIPFGLCIVKDIAERMEIKVPITDHMIRWHQDQMGKEYLKTKLDGKDVGETGVLSRYGFKAGKQGLIDFLGPDLIAHKEFAQKEFAQKEEILSLMQGREFVFCFDVDETFWSFTVEEVEDFKESDIFSRMYPDVLDILHWLKEHNQTITLASRTWDPERMKKYLEMVGIDMTFFQSPQLYPTGYGRPMNTEYTPHKIKHFQELEQHFDLDQILFFDNDPLNIQTALEMGVSALHTPMGLYWEHILQMLRNRSNRA